MRVLVTGMGGELGTRVVNLLEERPDVEAVAGIDTDPPRRRIHRAEFHRIDPRDRHRTVAVIRDFAPTALVHLGVYEPNARTGPRSARDRTAAGAIAVLGAAAELGSLDRIVVRSGIEVYGRRRGANTRPDEAVVADPTSPFGRSLLHTERVSLDAGDEADVPVTRLRFAPIVGPHFPSPLGRYLRLPAVPVSAFSDLPFSLIHQEDAAAAIVAAVGASFDGAVNVVAPGAVTASQAARLGGRLPIPIAGPAWALAKVAAELLGAPLPDHTRELLVRGRTADGALATDVLGLEPAFRTPEVVKHLYEWASVTYLRVMDSAA
ncbi:hypothetical protein BH24ACT3_BH24ACT3_00760 [soil metagenome]